MTAARRHSPRRTPLTPTLTVRTHVPLRNPGQTGPGHYPQGAARLPAQSLAHRRHGDRPGAVLRPAARRRLHSGPGGLDSLGNEHVLLYMLGIPALVPTFTAPYSVVGEREQGTLEPVLTTPIRHEELQSAEQEANSGAPTPATSPPAGLGSHRSRGRPRPNTS